MQNEEGAIPLATSVATAVDSGAATSASPAHTRTPLAVAPAEATVAGTATVRLVPPIWVMATPTRNAQSGSE